MDKVSIIMPAYNCSRTISRAISSVINQSHINWELLITNDNSSDETRDVIEQFKDSRIKCINNTENEGIFNARNKSISQAKGTYIAFLDSDDSWLSKKLEIQLDKMKGTGHLMSHSSYYQVNKQEITLSQINARNLVRYQDMLGSNYIGNLTGIYNCQKLGKFYQKNIGHEDYEMWLRILKRTNSIGVNIPLANYKINNKSHSSYKLQCARWHFNILRKELGLSKLKACFYFSKYMAGSLFNSSQSVFRC